MIQESGNGAAPLVGRFLALCAATLALACTADQTTAASQDSGGGVCAPERSVACVGGGGCSGYQACNQSGTGFDSCVCADAGVDATTSDASSADGSADDAPLPSAISGVVQKGPFVLGSSVTIQELDANLVPTGSTFVVATKDALGDFDVPVNVTSQYVEVIASGYYFDELTNGLSTGQLTLRSLADLTNGSVINVNLMTSLSEPLVRNLVARGASFSQATSQAESALLSALGLTPLGQPAATVTLTGTTAASAELLAASLIVEQYALVTGTSEVAQLSQLLGEIGATTGDASGTSALTTLSASLCQTVWAIDVASVRANLTAYYTSLGASVTIPPFEQALCAAGGSSECGLWCGASCVNQATNTSNCGACGAACAIGGSCQGGACACPSGDAVSNGVCCPPGETGCNGACVNEQTDSNNCGACGHVCPMAGCWAGGCTCPGGTIAPNGACLLPLAYGPGAYGPLVIDSANVYWTYRTSAIGNPGVESVVECAIGGCGGNPTVLAQSDVVGLALTATNVYWTQYSGPNQVLTCATSGCGGKPTPLVPGQGGQNIVSDGANVYWTNYTTGQSVPSSILSCPVGGCTNATTVVSLNGIPTSLAIDATNLYWTEEGSGRVMGCMRSACAANETEYATASGGWAGNIAVDATSVYWLADGVVKCPIAGCGGTPVTVFPTYKYGINGFVVDGISIYIGVADAAGTIFKCPSTGCGSNPTQIPTGMFYPIPYAVDATSLYMAPGPSVGLRATDVGVMKLTPK